MTTNNLANDSSFTEHKQHSVAHDGFVHELLHSAAYSFVQSPVEGAAQLFDHTAGKAIHSNLYKNCKDAIVSAPKQAAFASPEWHGQALGSAIGILPWFAATKGALKSIAAKSPLSTAILAADEAALNSSFFSRNTANLALEGGVSGAAFAGVFKPVDYKGNESNFWSAKAASMATDFATFATLNASSLAISKSISSAAAPLMERSNLADKTIPYVSMFAAGAGSGIPAAAAEMTTGAVLSNGNTNFGSRDFLQNAYSYAFIGGALSGLQMRSIKDHSIDTTNYRTNKTAEEKTANPQEQNANPMEQAESAAPTKTHYTAEEPQQTTFGVYETKGIKEYFKSIGFSKDGKTIDTMHLHEMVPVANVHMKLADMSPVFIIEEGTLHNIDFNRNGSVKPKQFWDYHFAIPTAEVSKVFDKLPNSTEFKEAVRGKIVGTLPEAFKTAGIDQESGLKALNSLARALRNLDGALPPQKKIGLGAIQIDLPEFEIKAGEGKIKVTKAGIGEVAHVYKLKVGDESFAFKVPSDAMRQDVHGVAAETAAFAFLNKHKISDLVEFYAANPNAEGWMLTEFVEKPKQREGTPLKEILDRYGLTLGDDWSANRGPGNVVWDIGGIEPKEVNSPSTLPELEKLLNTPEGKMIAGRKLGNFTDQSTLKEALLMVLNWDKNAGQVPRTAVRLLKNSDDISEVLSRSLRSSGSAGRAAFELDRLSETPLISKLFYEAITKKESRLEAAKMIDRLPKSDRFEAFKQAIIYPEARAMAARSIESLPSNNRKAAIEMLQSDPGARYVMLETRLMKGNHFEDKQNALEQYFDQYGLKTGKRTNVQEKTPDFKAMYPDDEIAQIIVAEIWPQLTLEQKKMTPSSLKKLQSSWALLEPEQWKTLNESEISEFISACKNFEFEGDAIYDHPDLRKYLASIDTPSDHSIEAWMSLPRKFKQLPPADLSDIIDLWPHTDLNNLSHMPMHDVVKMARILKSVENTSIKSQIIEDANLRDAILRHPEEFSALPKDRLLVLVGLWHQISEKDKSRSLKELAEISLVRKYDQLIKELGIKESAMIYFSKFNSAESFFNALLQIQQRNQMLSGGLPNKIIADKVNALARQKLKNEDLNPYKIEIEAQVEMLFEKHPKTLARLKSLKLDYESFKKILDGAMKVPQSAPGIIDLAIAKNWLSGEEGSANRLYSLMRTAQRAQLNEHQVQNLMSLSPSTSMLDSLTSLAIHDKRAALYLQTKLNKKASVRDLDPDIIADKHIPLRHFTEEETTQLQKMADHGLSLIQIATFAEERESNREYVRQLLQEELTVQQFKDVLKLSLFPKEIALKLAGASWDGRIRLEDLVGGLKDYKHGHAFSVLLKDHVINDRPIDREAISKLREEAAQSDTSVFGPSPRHTENESRKTADVFVHAADSIIKKIPPDQPIVLLGRDAWPLVPILRERGRNAMYFLYSRLQHDDENTHKQWLREIPPGAAVIDTGFSGTIINAIKSFDPSVKGYLMSSKNSEYPQLLNPVDANQVRYLEDLPKLIYRTHRHTEDGNAISRRKSKYSDSDAQHFAGAKFRFRAESNAREILRGADMPEWTTWRYSTFVGLTPKERLGLSNSEEVQKHYESVVQARKSVLIHAGGEELRIQNNRSFRVLSKAEMED